MPFLNAALIALPFLFPVVAGPSVNAWQLLFAWACIAFLLLLSDARGEPLGRAVLSWLVLCAACVALRHGDAWGFRLPACIAIAGVGMAALVGARMSGGTQGAVALAWGVLASGLASAVLGLLQYYGLAEPLVPWTTSPALGQAYGNLRQRNQFATLISLSWCAVLWLHATSDSTRTLRGLMAAGLLLLIAAAASTSRTGLLQLLSILGVASFIARRERRRVPQQSAVPFRLPAPRLLLAAIPLYFAIAWVLPRLAAGGGSGVETMIERLKSGAPDDHSRILLWRNVLALISEHPWTGWGWGELSYAHYSASYSGGRFVEILDNAHNLPLHLAVELGIPAAVLICGGFLWLVLRARPWRERDPVRLMAWGMLWAIVLHSLLEYPLWYGPFQLVFGLCIGLLWPGRHSQRIEKAAPYAAAALLAIVGYAGWDYLRISQIYLPREERLAPYEDDTLAKIRASRLFANQVQFAELTLTTVTRENAGAVHELAKRVMHFSPEPRVIVKLIESAELLGHEAEAREEAERFSNAFPADFARWMNADADDGAAP